ncbi:MAG: HEPN domain-containing protein [Euryarchaeota archaeon]|nr:HEPN domain-containing protein [Euryarchaeota archaeon]
METAEFWRLELQRAGRALDDARDDLSGGRHESASNRAYYASFHAARSLLHRLGAAPKSHRGILTLYGRTVTQPGLAPPETLRDLSRLHSLRQLADYPGPERDITQEEAREAVEMARAFIEEAKRAHRRIGDR